MGGLLAILTTIYAFEPPVSTLMLARWALRQPVQRDYTPLGAISPALVAAVVNSEDARFCRHHGVDWGELREVLAEGGDAPSRGASTITMQTVKNLYLWPSRSAIRKGLEIALALGLDFAWTKRRILEVYLNIAEWGDGIFGIEAAAHHYFGKSAGQLDPREAALLATALPNPFLRDAARPSPVQKRLTARLMRRVRVQAPIECLN